MPNHLNICVYFDSKCVQSIDSHVLCHCFATFQLSAQELELSYQKEVEKLKELMPDEEEEDPNGK